MSDDAPTQRFDTPAPATPPKKKSNRLVPLLIILGSILVIAIVVLAVVLLTRAANPKPAALTTTTPAPTTSTTAPAPSQAPTPTPSASKTSAPPPVQQGTSIQFFTIDNSTHPVIYCDTQSPNPTEIDLTFHWATTDVSQVYLGVDTADASQGALFSNLPPSGTEADFPNGYNPYSYPCPSASQEFTLTVIGGNGAKVSRMVTVENKGDTH